MEEKTEAVTLTVSAANVALYKALAAFQAELPDVRKDKTGTVKGMTKDNRPFEYDYQYADLAGVVEQTMPLLSKHGLAWVALPKVRQGSYVLVGLLTHEEGGTLEGEWPLPAQAPPQTIGAHMTYGKRYLLQAMTSVVADVDDDAAGQQAAQPQPRKRAEPKVTDSKRQAAADEKHARAVALVEAAQQATTYEMLKAVYDEAKAAGLLTQDVEAYGQQWKLSGLLNYCKTTLEEK